MITDELHVTPDARTRAVATVQLAMSTDPVIRWLFPDPVCYRDAIVELFELASGPGLEADTVDTVDGGVAVWAPPGTTPDDDAWAGFWLRHIEESRLPNVAAWGEAIGRHHPTEPHWYLAVMGVDPIRQGQGIGSSLLQKGLERCDRDGVPAYLESGNHRNRILYERHGFEVAGELRLESGPPSWAMLRPPHRWIRWSSGRRAFQDPQDRPLVR